MLCKRLYLKCKLLIASKIVSLINKYGSIVHFNSISNKTNEIVWSFHKKVQQKYSVTIG